MSPPEGRRLSDMQLSMLAHEAIAGRPIYNMPWCVRIEGELEGAMLDHALNKVVGRHAVLRSRYENGFAYPLRNPPSVLRTATYPTPDDVFAAAGKLWDAPIDIATGPPLQALLAQVPGGKSAAGHRRDKQESQSYLAVSLHHVAGDSWSFGLLAGELSRACSALVRGEPAAGPAPDFFDQVEEDRGRRWDTQFWRDALADVDPSPVPDAGPTSADCCAVRSVDLGLDAVDTREIRTMAREARVSPTAAVFAAVSVAVGAEEHSTLGMPAVLRDTRRQQETIGPLLNTVPVHTAWPGAATGLDLVRAHARSIDASLAHKEVPYSRILKAAGFRRGVGSGPPFLHVVNVDTEAARLRLPGLRTEPVSVPPRWAIFPAMWEFGWGVVGNVRGALYVSRDVFTEAATERLVTSFRAALHRVLHG